MPPRWTRASTHCGTEWKWMAPTCRKQRTLRASGRPTTSCLLSLRDSDVRPAGVQCGVWGRPQRPHWGDRMPTDAAGAMLQETAELADLVVVNTVPNLCVGGPSRSQLHGKRLQESTVDYVLCFFALLPRSRSMVIHDHHDDQLGSGPQAARLVTLCVPTVKGKKSALRDLVWN